MAQIMTGSYRTIDYIAGGYQATVYSAFKTTPGASTQVVAIKVFEHDNIRTRSRKLQQLWNELGANKILYGHKHILAMERFIPEMEWPDSKDPNKMRKVAILEMPLIENGELFDYIAEGPLHLDMAKALFLQLLDAVSFSHQHAIAHRDLKPENILVGNDFRLLVADWGLSAVLRGDAQVDASTWSAEALRLTPAGTRGYMAPEICSGERYNPFSADIWSLGVIFFCMVSGYPPFSCAMPGDWWYNQVRSGNWDYFWASHEHVATFDSQTKLFMQHILHPEPCRRPSATQMLHEPWMMSGYQVSAVDLAVYMHARKDGLFRRKRLMSLQATVQAVHSYPLSGHGGAASASTMSSNGSGHPAGRTSGSIISMGQSQGVHSGHGGPMSNMNAPQQQQQQHFMTGMGGGGPVVQQPGPSANVADVAGAFGMRFSPHSTRISPTNSNVSTAATSGVEGGDTSPLSPATALPLLPPMSVLAQPEFDFPIPVSLGEQRFGRQMGRIDLFVGLQSQSTVASEAGPLGSRSLGGSSGLWMPRAPKHLTEYGIGDGELIRMGGVDEEGNGTMSLAMPPAMTRSSEVEGPELPVNHGVPPVVEPDAESELKEREADETGMVLTGLATVASAAAVVHAAAATLSAASVHTAYLISDPVKPLNWDVADVNLVPEDLQAIPSGTKWFAIVGGVKWTAEGEVPITSARELCESLAVAAQRAAPGCRCESLVTCVSWPGRLGQQDDSTVRYSVELKVHAVIKLNAAWVDASTVQLVFRVWSVPSALSDMVKHAQSTDGPYMVSGRRVMYAGTAEAEPTDEEIALALSAPGFVVTMCRSTDDAYMASLLWQPILAGIAHLLC